MPYISQKRRNEFNEEDKTQRPKSIVAGELNYEITLKCNRYIQDNGLSYAIINDIIGALEGAKLEFYRRVAVPYEDRKIQENGDVY